MRNRVPAVALMAMLATGPALANICALNCDLDVQPAAPSSCHEEAPAPAPDHHPASSCAHDHVTPRAALKASFFALDSAAFQPVATVPQVVSPPTESCSVRVICNESPPRSPVTRPLRI
jgi:hypothetical protein